MILFHVSKIHNRDSILSNGLLTDSNKRLSIKSGFCNHRKEVFDEYYSRYGIQPIFLTSNPKRLISEQLTHESMLNTIIFEVDVSNIPIEWEYEYFIDHWNKYFASKEQMMKRVASLDRYTFISRHDIERERIKIKT